MAILTDTFDLGALRLSSGEGRRLDLHVGLPPYELGGETYPVTPAEVPVRLDVSRTTGQGYSLRMRFTATLTGPCMRCLEPASPSFEIDSREISQPGAGEELDSPYVEADRGLIDVAGWAHDALALVLPATVLCRPGCAGICPVCGIDLNAAGPDHAHEPAPDPRWAKLSELSFEPDAPGC